MAVNTGWQVHTTPAGEQLWIFSLRGSMRGQLEDKTALLTGGIHGDEYEGPAALAKFVKTLNPDHVCGTIVVLPMANPAAFAAGTRTNPADGLNLARCFPGRLDGQPTERLAAWLWEHFACEADFAIDLHSGGVSYQFLPLAGFYGDPGHDNASYQSARAFGLPYVWHLPATDGVLSYEMWKRGTTVIGNEYLGAGQLAESGVSAYRDGVECCLGLWGFLSEPRKTRSQVPQILSGDWNVSTSDGIFRAECRLGNRVERGQRVGSTVDIRGQVREEFYAEREGLLAAVRSEAHIHPGDWAVLITQIESERELMDDRRAR